jgi:hypothetical protein
MKALQIYDNGGESLDRYTVFKSRQKGRFDRYGNRVFEAVAASKTGAGVYMHIEAIKGPHLGKRVDFDLLDDNLKDMLKSEFES